MSETIATLNDRATAICACLGDCGITHLDVHTYQVNAERVSSVTATGDCGEGVVSVTAIREGGNSTYMMRGPATTDGDPGHMYGADVMRGVYRDVGHELLWLLAEHPGVGAVDLPFVAEVGLPLAA